MKCSMKCTRKTFPEINPEINLSARQFSLLWRRVNIAPRQGVLRENTWFNITEVNGRHKFSPTTLIVTGTMALISFAGLNHHIVPM